MPQRPKSHVIADKAIAVVSGVLADAGHAVETVVNDYGEDLLVQTSHAGRMDASRLWFQVKGTDDLDRYRLKGGDFSYSVSFEHALRWSRSLDLVAVVLCDVRTGDAWYAIPVAQIDEWAGVAQGQRSVTLRFPKEDRLTEKVAVRLAWLSRLNHYRHLILSARNIEAEAEEHGFDQDPLVSVIVVNLLETLGISESLEAPDTYRISASIRDSFEKNFKDLAEKEDDVEMAVYEAAVLTVLERANEIDPDLGLSQVILEAAGAGLVNALGLRRVVDELRSEKE